MELEKCFRYGSIDSSVFGEIDVSGAIYLFLTAAGLYQGRKILSDGKKVELDSNEDKK